MLPELTPEQAAKLARLWVWLPWQQAVSPGGALWRIEDADGPTLRRLRINGYGPDLDDAVTRDGLLRTARAAWQSPRLHAQPLWDFDEPDKIARWDIHGAPRCAGKTEEAALLAAILAAPEAK